MIRPALVLAYHGLGQLPRVLDPHNQMVPPEQFEQHVRSLQRRRYNFVTLSDFVTRLRAGEPLRGVCALTFDDGFADHATVLLPLLERLAVPATVFVCPGLLGQPHPFMARDAEVSLMTREQLLGLAASPLVEIGSHTITHTDLSNATEDEAFTEMASSKAALEALLDKPVLAFAYPFGGYSTACLPAAARAGYIAAVTCSPRGGLRPYDLRREGIDPLDGRLSFALKSRRLFWPMWQSSLGRCARWATRQRRHGSAP